MVDIAGCGVCVCFFSTLISLSNSNGPKRMMVVPSAIAPIITTRGSSTAIVAITSITWFLTAILGPMTYRKTHVNEISGVLSLSQLTFTTTVEAFILVWTFSTISSPFHHEFLEAYMSTCNNRNHCYSSLYCFTFPLT